MSDRRFSEEEVTEILKYAAEAQHSETSLVPSRSGLTLAELEEIGREVGIAPEVMKQAAQRIDNTSQPARKFLGLPLGVGRTVDLDRKLTDDEWERLVVDLREMFDARGIVKQEGSLRTWTNGNLQALLEPTAVGQRLRLRTRKGDAPGLIVGGIGLFGLASVMFIAAALKGVLADVGFLSALTVMGVSGAGMFGSAILGLPRWARLRQRQMDEIAERVASANRPTPTLPPD
ncbi:MAG: hypothetical protein ABI681_08090 [Gemmatimonadales bacterium]